MAADVMDTRRQNLRVLAEQWGGPTGLAKKLKYSGPSYVSQLTSGHRPITEKTARRVEKSLALKSGWMDAPHNLPIAQAKIDESVVLRIMRSVNAAIEEAGMEANLSTIQRLVELIYENAIAAGEIDEAYVRKVVNLLKK